jgi:hypothetical protein
MLKTTLNFYSYILHINSHGKSLLCDSGIVNEVDAPQIYNCIDCDASHKQFANMCLALWTLSVSQYLVERRAQLTDNNIDQQQQQNNRINDNENDTNDDDNHNDGATSPQNNNEQSIASLLDDFILHLDLLRRKSGTSTLAESAKAFVFNMATLHFLYQMALRNDIVRLKAVVLKAFFPLWFMADANTANNNDDDDDDDVFQRGYAVHALRYFVKTFLILFSSNRSHINTKLYLAHRSTRLCWSSFGRLSIVGKRRR